MRNRAPRDDLLCKITDAVLLGSRRLVVRLYDGIMYVLLWQHLSVAVSHNDSAVILRGNTHRRLISPTNMAIHVLIWQYNRIEVCHCNDVTPGRVASVQETHPCPVHTGITCAGAARCFAHVDPLRQMWTRRTSCKLSTGGPHRPVHQAAAHVPNISSTPRCANILLKRDLQNNIYPHAM